MLHSKELASPKQMALALAILEQTATGKESSNSFIAVSTASTSVSTGSRVSIISKQEQERAIVNFGAIWRPVLALESWAGHVDTQRVELWQTRYDDHRLIHDLLVQNTTMQHELQELRDRATTVEREGSQEE
ncbi:hypothetical protein Tco_1113783 [Tanacetum coccineum]|uniref:Uncharacterized protein n=1 Tax=Tanacetum coccineum TaxID=301880 RepID=A0ABQ5IUR7_9ASTR